MSFNFIPLETSIILSTHVEYQTWDDSQDVMIQVSYPSPTELNKEVESNESGGYSVSHVKIHVYQVSIKK